MKLMRIIIGTICLLKAHVAFTQTLVFSDSTQTGVSFRGMSITRDGTIWVSGSKGTIGKSAGEGKSWTWVKPSGFENRDFRDIEGFNNQTALAMAVDSPGIILRTTDGGISWKTVYQNEQKGIFLDDMAFRNEREGVCVGDPLEDGRLLILSTQDGGETWQELETGQKPLVIPGEAMFAASGSNATAHPDNHHAYLLVTGGKASRLWTIYPFQPKKEPKVTPLPVQQGGQMTGANGITAIGSYLLIPGGDYTNPTKSDSNFAIVYKNRPPQLIELAGGYRSSIADNGYTWRVACGISGISIHDGPFASYPTAWKIFSQEPFHVVRNQPGSSIFWLAGQRGRIAILKF
jgi:hypothetical protein